MSKQGHSRERHKGCANLSSPNAGSIVGKGAAGQVDHTAYSAAAKAASSLEELDAISSEYCEALGFEYFLYAVVLPLPLSAPEILVLTNYPDVWRDRYVERNYAAIDPVVRHCATSLTPAFWDELDLTDPGAAEMMADARSHGLMAGVTVPIASRWGSSALLSMASDQDDASVHSRFRTAAPHIQVYGIHAQEAVLRIYSEPSPDSDAKPLSEREKSCLMWAAEGKTAWEIAQILAIRERTVVFHLNKAAEKLGAVNRQQAIARAMALGEIRPHHFALFSSSE